MTRRRHHLLSRAGGLLAVAVVVAAAVSVAGSTTTPVHAATASVSTFAGTPGSGPGERVSFSPFGLLDEPRGVTIGDASFNVIRSLDLASGALSIAAGRGGWGPPGAGDGGPAAAALFRGPSGFARLPDGSLLVADSSSARIRRIDTSGRISSFAGGGSALGDGGPATQARFGFPVGIAATADGDVFVADSLDSRVRRIASDGTIATIAGTGAHGFSGDGGPASAADLSSPQGVAVASDGAVVIADTRNNRVRRVGADGTISTIAGTGIAGGEGDGGPADLAQLNGPEGVESATDGVYIADTFNNRVRRIATDGTISTVAGTGTGGFFGDGGPATSAWLFRPQTIAIGPHGLFITDGRNFRVRRVSAGIITTVAGNGENGFAGDGGPASAAQLNLPYGIDVGADGSVYFADTQTHRIRRVSASGSISTVAGNGDYFSGLGDGGPATAANIKTPFGIDVTSDGTIYIADMADSRIRMVAPDGTISTVAGTGTHGPAVDGLPATESSLNIPQDVAVSGDVVYVADTLNNRVRRIGPDGVMTTVAGSGVDGSSGDFGAATAASLSQPRALAVLGDGDIVIAEGSRLRRVDVATGRISTLLASVNVNDLAVGADGALYLCETSDMRVERLGADGARTTVAGTGQFGFNGDGAISTTTISWPTGVAIDPGSDVIYVSDSASNRIRRVAASAPAGTTTTTTPTSPSAPPTASGYWMLSTDGSVYAFGDYRWLGNVPGQVEAVDLEPTPDRGGYWILAADGAVYGFGNAGYRGGANGRLAPGERATSLSGHPGGRGYWVFTDLGRVIPFGDAGFFGDMRGVRLNGPVLDAIATPDGRGYYMVASDGGVFTFGSATFTGSMGATRLNAPVQSLVPDADGRGYWLVASDGGVFTFAATFYGSMGAVRLNKPITGMVASPSGRGYLMVAEDGGTFTFGDVAFRGSLGSSPPPSPIASIAAGS